MASKDFSSSWRDKECLGRYMGNDSEVSIPECYSAIDEFAFGYRTSLKTLSIPRTIKKIRAGAFEGCTSIERFIVADDNVDYWTDGYALFSRKGELLRFASASSVESYIVPEGITTISRDSFSDCCNLKELTISEGVTEIEDKSIRQCSALERIYLPSTLEKLGVWLFKDCPVLGPLRINCGSSAAWIEKSFGGRIEHEYELYVDGEKLTEVSLQNDFGSSFRNCVSLEKGTIGEQANTWRNSAVFANCVNMVSLDIYASSWDAWVGKAYNLVGNLPCEYNLFIGGNEVTELSVDGPIDYRNIDAFRGIASLQKLTLPMDYPDTIAYVVQGSRIASIALTGEGTQRSMMDGVLFTEKGDLELYPAGRQGESYVIPGTTPNVGKYAFCNCPELRTVSFASADTWIDSNAFTSRERLRVVLHPEVDDFPDYAFAGNVVVESENPSVMFNVDACKDDDYFKGAALILPNVSIADVPSKLKKYAAIGFMMHVVEGGSASDDIFAAYLKYIKSQRKKLVSGFRLCPEVATFLINEALVPTKDIDWFVAAAKAAGSSEIAACFEAYRANPKKKNDWRAASGSKASTSSVAKQAVEPYVAEHLSGLKVDAAYKVAVKTGVKLANGEGECSPEAIWLLLSSFATSGKVPSSQPRKPSWFAQVDVSGVSSEIVSWLDRDALQRRLQELYYDKNLRQALMPLCALAQGDVLEKVVEHAKKQWAATNSARQDIYIARGALMHNQDESVMGFANDMGLLDEYARIRKTTADALRDVHLSDLGFDDQGRISFDLGEGALVATLSADLKVSLYDERFGKAVKSVPKKGVDEEKYEEIKASVTSLKKEIREIVKQRKKLLFDDCLSGRKRPAAEWESSYLKNPVLQGVARLVVWSQGKKTFTVADGDLINSSGKAVKLGKAAVSVAHVSEMDVADVEAWRDYFARNGLKQPFEQVWERIVDFDLIEEDRYSGQPIPFYRFRGREKHGIKIEDYNFHDEIIISFDDCAAKVERLDWARHFIDNPHRFEVKSFEVTRRSRMANHVVAYLDRITIFGRIAENDLGVMDYVKSSKASLADVLEYIDVAAENNATELSALLLGYRKEHFPEYKDVSSLLLD